MPDGFILKFDMRDAEQRAACGSFMKDLAYGTVAKCEAAIRAHETNILQKRAELRRALRRQPSPDAHLLGQTGFPKGPERSALIMRKCVAIIEQQLYLDRWAEVRRLCWSIRCTRRGLAEMTARRDRLRMEMIIARDHGRPSADADA